MQLLIAEDHADIAASVRDFLVRLGHGVEWQADGAEALRRALIADFDVIVLDRMLPRLDGATFCRRLREHKRTPVLMLTALDSLDDKLEGFAAGADDYLPKPFALAELRVRIEALHRRANLQVPEATLRVADLCYDLRSLQATRGGQTLTLNPTTRRLLELLMRQAPAVVTRQVLQQGLWGDEPPHEDVLRIHMHALRNAIDKPFERKLLVTVHGVGYRLDTHADR